MAPTHLHEESRYSYLTVLVVEDQSSMLSVIKGILLNIGFKKVLRATNGREALSVLEKHDVDVILSDFNMPRMNGLNLLKAVRHTNRHAEVPFIMITGNINQDDVRNTILAGVSEYLVKPFNSNSLKEKIDKAFATPIPRSALQAEQDEEESVEESPELVSKIEQSSGKHSILIVDDEPMNITVLTELLKEKYSLKAALSGERALSICNGDDKPDLILLDIMMPNMDGLAVCKKLKQDQTTAHIPVIFISALSQTSDVVKGLSIGAVDYISKPVIPEITLARIATHIAQVKQRASMVSQLDTMMENMRLREDFERITNHDLRTPLTAILTAAETLKEEKSYKQEEVKQIIGAADTVKQMVDEQVLVYQLENKSTKRELVPVNAFELLNKVVYGQYEKCKDLNVYVDYNLPKDLFFMGEEVLAYNLFNNLLSNAIEAAPSGTEVHLSFKHNENFILFSIQNQGMIPEKIRTRFFDKFITYGKEGGTGLGTYSAILSAKAMGGDINFTTSEEKGTTLFIKLNASVKGKS